MPRSCSVCAHPEAVAINEAIVGVGERGQLSNRAITRQYQLSKDAVRRHREHIPELLLKASQAIEVADADELLLKIEDLYREALAVLEAGKDDRDHRLVLSAIDRAGKQLETLAEMRGALDRRPQVNILISEEWISIRTAMMEALEPYGEARVAISRRLLELEGGNGRNG